jgi:hypothetical protein
MRLMQYYIYVGLSSELLLLLLLLGEASSSQNIDTPACQQDFASKECNADNFVLHQSS